MLQYKIIENSRIEMLEREVTQLISDGWFPLGGVSVAYKHEHSHNIVSHLVYVQALTKQE